MDSTMRIFLLTVMMAVCGMLTAAEPTEAQKQYDLGSRYFQEGKYDMAVQCYRSAAVQGHAVAQNTMGVFCLQGRYGVKKDPKQAVFWFRKAAEKGWSPAQYYLGECYERGEGVEKDPKQAIQWYRKAAKQGNRGAVSALKRLQ